MARDWGVVTRCLLMNTGSRNWCRTVFQSYAGAVMTVDALPYFSPGGVILIDTESAEGVTELKGKEAADVRTSLYDQDLTSPAESSSP